MSFAILNDRQNPLVRRREILFTVEHPGSSTPTVISIRERLAALVSSELDSTFVVVLKSLKGVQRSEGVCHVYSSPDDARLFEPEHILRSNMKPEDRTKALEELKKLRSSWKARAKK